MQALEVLREHVDEHVLIHLLLLQPRGRFLGGVGGCSRGRNLALHLLVVRLHLSQGGVEVVELLLVRIVGAPLLLGVERSGLEPLLELPEVRFRLGSGARGGGLVLDGPVELLLELAEVLLDAVKLNADGLAPLLLFVELGFLLAYPLLHVPLAVLELLAEGGLGAREQRMVGVHPAPRQVHAVRVVARRLTARDGRTPEVSARADERIVVAAAAGAHLRAAVGARRYRR
mmetsp:Transcript_501/g.1867  ORF Transcript_501/g.1867 Transcript_501/m.1867 type:complete len:230 (+) Transcript_501:2255-2944(+)